MQGRYLVMIAQGKYVLTIIVTNLVVVQSYIVHLYPGFPFIIFIKSIKLYLNLQWRVPESGRKISRDVF